MVNMDMVLTKAAKGLTTGAGVFASTFVGDAIDDVVPGGDNGVAITQMAAGLGVAVGAERISDRAVNQNSFDIDAALFETGVEHFGYGIHGAGFAELADQIQTGAQTGQTVTVRANADNAQTSQGVRTQQGAASDFSLDTA
jgi:hypothetical protein